MKVTIQNTGSFLEKSALAKFVNGLSDEEIGKALMSAVQVVMNSTKVGYQDEVGPDGKDWEPNAEWYALMKGQSSVLTGPLTGKIKGGMYAGKYKMEGTSKKKMKNSLVYDIDVVQKKAKIEYDDSAKVRADLHQDGGEEQIVLTSTTGSGDLLLDIDIPARPHLGLADPFRRLGGRTDTELIEEIFGDQIGMMLGE